MQQACWRSAPPTSSCWVRNCHARQVAAGPAPPRASPLLPACSCNPFKCAAAAPPSLLFASGSRAARSFSSVMRPAVALPCPHPLLSDAYSLPLLPWRLPALAAQQATLLELLEAPQLMDTCVRNGIYDEALDLAAFINRFVRGQARLRVVCKCTPPKFQRLSSICVHPSITMTRRHTA